MHKLLYDENDILSTTNWDNSLPVAYQLDHKKDIVEDVQ